MSGMLDFSGPMMLGERIFRFDDTLLKVLCGSSKAPNFTLEVHGHTGSDHTADRIEIVSDPELEVNQQPWTSITVRSCLLVGTRLLVELFQL